MLLFLGHTGGLIWALTTASGLFMLTQIAFQIALAARKPYGKNFIYCIGPEFHFSHQFHFDDSVVFR